MQEETKKFLQFTTPAREASLMVAENEKALETLEREAGDFGFKQAKNVREIFNGMKNGEKIYFVLQTELGENIYNILVQYPTGQINAYDGKENLVANPNYQSGAVLILITEENLRKIERSEKSLLRIVGLIHRK